MSADEKGGLIPPERWIPHPVSDHGDLDRPDPQYARDLKGADRAEYDAAEKDAAEKKAAAAKPAVEPGSKRRKRRRKPKPSS